MAGQGIILFSFVTYTVGIVAVVVAALRFFHALDEGRYAARIDGPLLIVSAVISVIFVITGVTSTRTGQTSVGTYAALAHYYLSTVPCLLWALISTIVLWTTEHRPSGGVDLDAHCSRYGITAREREILAAISRGLSNQEIANRLFISLQTLKTHAHHLYEKTDTTGRTSLPASIQSFE